MYICLVLQCSYRCVFQFVHQCHPHNAMYCYPHPGCRAIFKCKITSIGRDGAGKYIATLTRKCGDIYKCVKRFNM